MSLSVARSAVSFLSRQATAHSIRLRCFRDTAEQRHSARSTRHSETHRRKDVCFVAVLWPRRDHSHRWPDISHPFLLVIHTHAGHMPMSPVRADVCDVAWPKCASYSRAGQFAICFITMACYAAPSPSLRVTSADHHFGYGSSIPSGPRPAAMRALLSLFPLCCSSQVTRFHPVA